MGCIHVQHLAPRIRAELLMGVGPRHQIFPPATRFAAYNKISAPNSLALYPDFTRETLPGHSDLIFEFMDGP